jgi:hypothetical protein
VAPYAALGLDGLLHYTRAPFAEHSAAMNLTILLEAGTAVALLGATFVAGLNQRRGHRARRVSPRIDRANQMLARNVQEFMWPMAQACPP